MKTSFGLILLYLVISVTAVHSQILKGPANALKKFGDSVTLECVTSSNNCDNVEWRKMEGAQSARIVYRDDIGILNGFPRERYGINSTGGCNLIITQLGISDSGQFICVKTADHTEETRSSILVVISVRESCLSNVMSNALTEGDGYSFSTAINVPAKSVEPSNVILTFLNKAADETETTDESQPQTVKTTITGIARKEIITQRVCMASFPPYTAADFDRSTATLDVCTTQQLLVSYPVESVTVWANDDIFYERTTISCIADGYPMPTFLWKNLTSGLVVQNGSNLNITKDSFGHNFSCIATNTVNGIKASVAKSVIVPKPSDGSAVAVQSQILKGPVNALKKVGDNVSLECVASSKNCDQVEWKKLEGAQSAKMVYMSGIILNGFSDGRYSVNSTGGCNLIIRELEVNDSGRFSCVLQVDDMEETRGSVLVVIAVQSQITKGPTNALNKVGDSVTLECVTRTSNCDGVEWKKLEGAQSARTVYTSGIMLNGFPGERYSVNSTGGCSLIIKELEVNDSGRFTCVLLVDDREETKGSILVVIDVKESCRSNVTSYALNQYDSYSFWTAINVPAKSVEPSNVTLSFQNKTAYETETTDESQSKTVKTTFTGIARKENITQHVCRASFPPNTADGFDRTTATMDICTSQQLNVSPVQSQILKGPVNVLQKVGYSVTLECVTSSNNCDNVEWKKLERAQSSRTVYRGVIFNSFSDGRYSVINTGGCSLTIIELEVNDSGRFMCVLHVGDREQTRGSVLVVISVREECLSNVTSNALNQYDSYSFWTAINVPTKSVEPSNVTLYFQNKTADETETMVDSQHLTVKKTLTGIARRANIVQRVCMASFSPNTAAGFDYTTATLVVCTTQQLLVSPVESQILKGPVNALKRVGDSVMLECVTSSENCEQLHWSKMEGAQSARKVYTDGIILNGFPSKRYSASSTGGCNLIIRGLEVNDSGRFSCVLTVGDREKTRGSILVVIDPVENIVLLSPNNDIFQKWNTINCTADGYPIKHFPWKNLPHFLVVQNGSSLNISKKTFGPNFTCIATNTDIDPVENVLKEWITISCITDGNPMPTFLSINLTSVHVGHIIIASSPNITKDILGHNFTCTVNGEEESGGRLSGCIVGICIAVLSLWSVAPSWCV